MECSPLGHRLMVQVKTFAFVGALFLNTFSLFDFRPAVAASCCGGSSASSLLLPKGAASMLALGLANESYNGYYDSQGSYRLDPPQSQLRQMRMSVGYAIRLGSRWQGSITLPLVYNQNRYNGVDSKTYGFGDTSLSVSYEFFDTIKCVWQVNNWQDLVPAIYTGVNASLPTGISPYSQVENSFDITGRGFYRLSGYLLLDKTIYPWNTTLRLSYGDHFERDINQEYGQYVEPYRKKLGSRINITPSFGYTYFFDSMDAITATLGFSYLKESSFEINGHSEPSTGFNKKNLFLSLAYSPVHKLQIYSFSWQHNVKKNDWGENNPATDTFSLEFSYVFW